MTEEAKTPTFGRAFNAAVGADWMITEDGLKTLLTIAARVPVEKAVEAYDDAPLEYTRQATIRDGVAIIPVEGPIFRYSNLFTRFSGGASVEIMAKDFISALDNSKVDSILFEINSPGGEVTGINEFCEMVYAARSQKPITARVGGLGCSAAYWLASACGDIACDETAMLGSIGVMSVYMDDRKMLEMNGLEELEFISSQSPYKNAPPYEAEGKRRIQARIDALAQVFVEKVARNRGVSVETVLKEFGQGDVFVGQAAVDAGLADRLDSFESSVFLLASTHNPNLFGGESADSKKTINNSAHVEFEPVETNLAAEAEPETKNGDLMHEENKDLNTAADEAAANTDTDPTPPAAPAAAASASSKDSNVEDFEDLKAKFKASEEARAKDAARIAELETAATDKWIDEQTAALAGEKDANVSVLGSLVKAYGKDSDEVKAYLTNQAALSEQIAAGGLFSEIGKSGADTDNSAEAKLTKLAKERATAEKISYEQAYTAVLTDNPDLAAKVI